MQFRGASLRIGYASNIAWALVFFPVTRLSSILPLIGLTFESSIKYHIWVGQVVMITSALHSIGFIIYWAMVNQMSEVFVHVITYFPCLVIVSTFCSEKIVFLFRLCLVERTYPGTLIFPFSLVWFVKRIYFGLEMVFPRTGKDFPH